MKKIGFHDRDDNGIPMVDFHAENFEMSPNNPKGRNCSVPKSKEEQTVMIAGQQESIFKPFWLKTKMWTSPKKSE